METRLPKGTLVATHAATDAWMQGDRYGTITGYGKARPYIDRDGVVTHIRPYLVKLDRSGRTLRFHPSNVYAIVEDPT